MSSFPRTLPGALERVGALIEAEVSKQQLWRLGAVERESGQVEAYVLVGLGRSPAHLRFSLSGGRGKGTEVDVALLAKSRWSRRSTCIALAASLLDAVAKGCASSG